MQTAFLLLLLVDFHFTYSANVPFPPFNTNTTHLHVTWMCNTQVEEGHMQSAVVDIIIKSTDLHNKWINKRTLQRQPFQSFGLDCVLLNHTGQRAWQRAWQRVLMSIYPNIYRYSSVDFNYRYHKWFIQPSIGVLICVPCTDRCWDRARLFARFFPMSSTWTYCLKSESCERPPISSVHLRTYSLTSLHLFFKDLSGPPTAITFWTN